MEQLPLDLQDTSSINVEQLVAMYVQIRDVVREKEEKHKEEMAVVEAQLEAVSNKLLEICNAQNTDSMKTAAGTVSRRVQSRYWTQDWEAMHQFILEHEAPFLLEKRIHNGNMKEFLTENPDLLPIGMQMDSKYVIQVRKATKKL